MRRRHLLLACALPFAGASWAAPLGTQAMLAGWADQAGRHFAGLLSVGHDEQVRVLQAIEVPTRAHGITRLPDGRVLVVARRPGEWMLAWRPGTAEHVLHWSSSERSFCGHALVFEDVLLMTAMDLESEQGVVEVRALDSLRPLGQWPSGGIDPHALIMLRDGRLLVANGGVATRPETGRLKLAQEKMDSSLAALNPRTGQIVGQWRLPDARLSIRHLAEHSDGLVGVALQAEHEDAADRAKAPLLAIFNGDSLRPVPATSGFAGYAGDIAALHDGFALGASRTGQVLMWSSGSGQCKVQALAQACALSSIRGQLWAGGLDVLEANSQRRQRLPEGVQLDNHWMAWSA